MLIYSEMIYVITPDHHQSNTIPISILLTACSFTTSNLLILKSLFSVSEFALVIVPLDICLSPNSLHMPQKLAVLQVVAKCEASVFPIAEKYSILHATRTSLSTFLFLCIWDVSIHILACYKGLQ